MKCAPGMNVENGWQDLARYQAICRLNLPSDFNQWGSSQYLDKIERVPVYFFPWDKLCDTKACRIVYWIVTIIFSYYT